MGKRELLLVVCFLIVGVVVYQVTAPPLRPARGACRFGRLIEAARREVGGNRALAELTTTTTHKLAVGHHRAPHHRPDFGGRSPGEDRADVESTLFVNSRAYNDAEAKQYAAESKLVADQTASALIFGCSSHPGPAAVDAEAQGAGTAPHPGRAGLRHARGEERRSGRDRWNPR